MHPSIKDRVVLMTGGGRGLGRTMAIALVEAGAKVAITGSREGGELAETEAELKKIGGADAALAVRADVASYADCERAVQAVLGRWGRLHILCNNAGRGMNLLQTNATDEPPPYWKAPAETVRTIVETNLLGVYNMARAATPPMLEAGWGRIVNVSTSMATMQRPGWFPYGVSKWGVEGATVIMARDLAGTGVTANALLPGGATNTRMIPGNIGDMQRMGGGFIMEPEIMVAPMLYLASALSDGKTGERYVAKLWNAALPTEQAAEASRFACERTRKY